MVFSMEVIQSMLLLVTLMQAVCTYLNKSLQTLLCNTHAFILPAQTSMELSKNTDIFIELKGFENIVCEMSIQFSMNKSNMKTN